MANNDNTGGEHILWMNNSDTINESSMKNKIKICESENHKDNLTLETDTSLKTKISFSEGVKSSSPETCNFNDSQVIPQNECNRFKIDTSKSLSGSVDFSSSISSPFLCSPFTEKRTSSKIFGCKKMKFDASDDDISDVELEDTVLFTKTAPEYVRRSVRVVKKFNYAPPPLDPFKDKILFDTPERNKCLIEDEFNFNATTNQKKKSTLSLETLLKDQRKSNQMKQNFEDFDKLLSEGNVSATHHSTLSTREKFQFSSSILNNDIIDSKMMKNLIFENEKNESNSKEVSLTFLKDFVSNKNPYELLMKSCSTYPDKPLSHALRTELSIKAMILSGNLELKIRKGLKLSCPQIEYIIEIFCIENDNGLNVNLEKILTALFKNNVCIHKIIYILLIMCKNQTSFFISFEKFKEFLQLIGVVLCLDNSSSKGAQYLKEKNSVEGKPSVNAVKLKRLLKLKRFLRIYCILNYNLKKSPTIPTFTSELLKILDSVLILSLDEDIQLICKEELLNTILTSIGSFPETNWKDLVSIVVKKFCNFIEDLPKLYISKETLKVNDGDVRKLKTEFCDFISYPFSLGIFSKGEERIMKTDQNNQEILCDDSDLAVKFSYFSKYVNFQFLKTGQEDSNKCDEYDITESEIFSDHLDIKMQNFTFFLKNKLKFFEKVNKSTNYKEVESNCKFVRSILGNSIDNLKKHENECLTLKNGIRHVQGSISESNVVEISKPKAKHQLSVINALFEVILSKKLNTALMFNKPIDSFYLRPTSQNKDEMIVEKAKTS
ncbi:hypothetical protein HDU92_008387 [Lobulomyces angularis]|nr:hypothetical protein HDU92_008387 [Lobulomyces angularis]